jgi:hypothetical protein
MNGYSAAGNLDRQPDLLARLQNVVRELNRPDIRTVSSLISKVIGDQNAGLMAVRLLHWFPRSKKAGGWVYKSWRDWNAECNLSQAQVKRVHSNSLLEIIGIERTIMKANGTPTVHYRLDENKLIAKLAEFLGMMQVQIQNWIGPQSPNEGGQNRQTNNADSDQLNEHNLPDEKGEDEPTYSAQSAKSITDSDSQIKQHKYNQSIQQSSYSAAVVDSKREEEKEILVSLGNFGIGYPKAKELIEKHSTRRVVEVIKQAKDQNCKNVAGYIIRALQENWTFWSKPEKEDYAWGDDSAYITGKYAAFINH